MTDEEMAAALKAKGWRIEPPLTQENCGHPMEMRWGSGSLGSDGSSKWSWTCRRCGKTSSGQTPARDVPVFTWDSMGWNTGFNG